ncbi:MAG TPA: NUDIX hydrolase [Polyangiaceae bacterium]|jgi:8-oxo-dGTP pyrophosphatase MutT (NUDIX family)|nr:NUDIX hydrolase [Polyangiaceae bacterium]
MLAADVREAVLRYAPSDAREASFRRRMLELSEGAAPFSRKAFFPGHFTTSAFVLSPDHARLLLIFHKKLQRWLQPGGHVEAEDASIVAAARREVEEETGVAGTQQAVNGLFDIDVHDIPARTDEGAHEHFDLRVLLIAPDDRVVASDEVADVRWVSLGEIEMLGTDESVKRAVRKLETWRSGVDVG